MGKITTYLKFNYGLNIIILVILCLATSLNAQKSIENMTQAEKEEKQIYPGYIVTSNPLDTVFGEIQFFNPTYNEITVIFYKDNIRNQFYPADGNITEYGFQYKKYNKAKEALEPHWFVYVRKTVPKSPIKGGEKEVFLERQIHGDITLYNYYTLKTSKINSRRYQHNYFIEKEGMNGFSLKTIEKANYRKMIRRYLVLGNNQIDENLGTAGFGYKYLADIVEIQNAWIEGSDEYYALMLEKGQVGAFSSIPESKVDIEKDKNSVIPIGNVDLDRDKEKIKTSGDTVIPMGSKVDTDTEKKESEKSKKSKKSE